MRQNIFDDQTFFEGYRRLRANENNANILIEKPALFSLLPPLSGKSVLDMGCGYGENCKEFVRLDASSVYGIDISKKMLEVARLENRDEKITYSELPMEEIDRLDREFDIVVSSLAVHYVCDFKKLARDVSRLLHDGGVFVFSQEHPLTTAPNAGAQWIRDDRGHIDHYRLSDYSVTGRREVSWFVDGVAKYHRTFSDLFEALHEADLSVDRLAEPLPSDAIMDRLPGYKNALHKPDFLIIRAGRKQRRP